MPNAYKSFGQLNPGAVLTDFFAAVPASTEYIVFVTISNKGTTNRTCRLKHAPAGAADNDDHNILYDLLIPANDSYVHPKPIYMATTDKLRVYGSHVDLTFTADGIEIT